MADDNTVSSENATTTDFPSPIAPPSSPKKAAATTTTSGTSATNNTKNLTNSPINHTKKIIQSKEIEKPRQEAIIRRNKDARAQQQAQHTAVISLTVRNTNKILKEIGFRRAKLRNVYKKCNNAIKILNDFKDAQWPPPKHKSSTTKSPNKSKEEGEETDIESTVMSSENIDNETISTEVTDSVAVEQKVSSSGDCDVGGMEVESEEQVNNNDDNDENKEFNVDDSTKLKNDLDSDLVNGVSFESVEMDDCNEDGGEQLNHHLDGNVNMKELNVITTQDSKLEIGSQNNNNEDHPIQSSVSSSSDENNDNNAITSSDSIMQEKAKEALNLNLDTSTVLDNYDASDGIDYNEQMHPAIKTALSCYCAVISNESSTPKMVEIALECIGLLISNRYVVGTTLTKAPRNADEVIGVSNDTSNGENDGRNNQSEVLYLINCICDRADHASDAVQTATSKALLALMTSPVCGVYEAGMLKAVRTVFHIYLVTKYDPVKKVTRAVLLDMLRSVFSRMEAYDAMSLDNSNGVDEHTNDISLTYRTPSKQDEQNSIFASRFHTDSYLLFRALCKLSAKLLPEDNDSASLSSSRKNIFSSNVPVSDPMATNTKILSLRLILAVFENCGPAFRDGEKFIYAVQNFLCVSLVKNSMSNNPHVAHLSLKVFLMLVYKFKQHLKAEIEVFVAKVFLPTLQSPNTPEERKGLVLEALRSLCADPTILTQIFLNYDCDFEAVDLYKTIVYHLTSLSVKNHQLTATATDASEKLAVSIAALEVLIVILQAFLKALDMPGGDDIFDDDKSKLRGTFHLDVGMAVKDNKNNVIDTTKDDILVSVQDIEIIQSKMNGNSSTENVAGKIVDAFDKKRIAQRNFETGSIKFTLSAKDGLLFFVQHGFLHLDAKEVAQFFLEHKEKLDKTQMGEIFGREPDASFVKGGDVDPEKGGVGFYIRVLHHYVDALDFTGLRFDDAIRLFLSGFRLPGESQKVDRIMEKFAERYTLQNGTVFPSADTAFILSFAVIMLQTDLHNPNIKPEKKMTVESFINMNKGISVDGGDLDKEFLVEIYESIKARPFTLKEDDDARESQKKSKEKIDMDIFFGVNNSKDKRRERFNKERAELVEASEHLFKRQKYSTPSTPQHLTESVCPADVVKPMFDITWGPLIGTLSQILEKAVDDRCIKLCLNGFVYSVRIAANCDMDLAKHTFVTSLAKFTALGSVDEMKTSNIESIRTLLSIAIMDGEKLGESWRPTLQCISQLGRLQFFASGVDSDDAFLKSGETVTKNIPNQKSQQMASRRDASQNKDSSKSAILRETEEFNSRAVLEAINEILIEKVFTSTTQLSDEAILHFVESLVLVSESEIGGDSKKDITGVGTSTSGSRIFSLHKLVEVADYNMNLRSRRSWAKIWDLMADYLVTIGCHPNANVSLFAIDALRQLSFKFLEKPELADFNFQRLFLRPFLSIMENKESREDTRELILQCIDNSIRSMSHNIRSGWKIFFSTLALSADDTSEKISTLGLAILQRLLDNNFDQLCRIDVRKSDNLLEENKEREISAVEAKERNTQVEDFIGLSRASMAFVESKRDHATSISLRALCHASVYADHIAEGKILPPVSGMQTTDKSAFGYTYEGLSQDEAKEMVLWRPILDGLSQGICSNSSVGNSEGVGCILQRGSVVTLRAILLRHGHLFTVSQWTVIMNKVILPAMQKAIEIDTTPVTKIISESPIVSNLDFFSEPLSLPPPTNDKGLQKFAAAAQSISRPYGDAELLVEASFADLRHGGDGNLSKAHSLVEKVLSVVVGNHEEPFPDSWVATTGPIALGMLTDIFCMIIIRYDLEDARKMWPIVMGQMQRWAVGCPLTIQNRSAPWNPSEALVRIGCKEISRLSETLITLLPRMEDIDAKTWLNVLCKNLGDTLYYSVELEGNLHSDFKYLVLGKGSKSKIDNDQTTTQNGIVKNTSSQQGLQYKDVYTPYGNGTIIDQRIDDYSTSSIVVNIDIVKLDFGAILYRQSATHSQQENITKLLVNNEPEIESQVTAPSSITREIDMSSQSKSPTNSSSLDQYISPLRVRCTASYCLQKCLLDFLDLFSTNCGEVEVSTLLGALEKSRVVASKASVDKDLSAAFEETILVEWGDKVEDKEKAFSSDGGVGHLRRSEMFFLTQESCANNVLIHFLALLYCPREDHLENKWDTVSFSAPLLIDRITDVLQKFIISEREDGHRIDPNVWRAASESGGTFAVHCTSFAVVVVNILKTIMNFSDAQFNEQKNKLFPILCSLIKIHSSEIRGLVADVMNRKVSVLLGMVTK